MTASSQISSVSAMLLRIIRHVDIYLYMKRVHAMKNILYIICGMLFLVLFFWFIQARGLEDRWICEGNTWIKHGNPATQKPMVTCPKKITLPKTKDECINSGFIWKKLGPDPFETCNRKAIDRGNICYDNSECEGQCQANLTKDELSQGMRGKTFQKTGQCSVYVVELGCRGIVKNGIAGVICMD
jgi:hypothetical protein